MSRKQPVQEFSGSLGCSPPVRLGSYGTSPAASCNILGSSPPSASFGSGHGHGSLARGSGTDRQAPYAAAKKFWKRLCFDPTLNPNDFTVSGPPGHRAERGQRARCRRTNAPRMPPARRSAWLRACSSRSVRAAWAHGACACMTESSTSPLRPSGRGTPTATCPSTASLTSRTRGPWCGEAP